MTVARAGGLPFFSASEYARRWASVHQLLESEGLDGLLLFGSAGGDAGVQYLSGWPPTREAWLVIHPGHAPTLLVNFYNHVPNAQRLAVLDDVRWAGLRSASGVVERLQESGLTSGRLGLVGSIPFQVYLALQSGLPNLALPDASPALTRLRLVKSEEELEYVRRAAALSDAAVAAVLREARPGLMEAELGPIAESAYLRDGGQNQIHYFGATSMAAPELCVPAQRPGSRVLQAGDVLFMEISAHIWNYAGQVLRTFSVADDPHPLYSELHRVAEETFDRVCDALHDGATAEEVVTAADWIECHGFTTCDDLLHGFVGGYLPPVLRSRSSLHEPIPDFVFREGMLVVVQPNVVTPDRRAGVQVGELVRIARSGVQRLHRAPRGLLRAG